MFVSGFTFIRNAVKFDYPVVEAIKSILPVCDECIVAVGKSDDNTRALIEQIANKKIRIIDTVWDDSLREGGRVLADETNKALAEISPKTDWAFYIQGDEVVHEKYLNSINENMLKYQADKRVEGLLFNYKHFYGSYDYVGVSKRWYRKEIRIVRPQKGLVSYKDAQGFRLNNQKLNVKPIDACIYHYGWVKHPKYQQEKQRSFNRLWHTDDWMQENVPGVDEFDYSNIDKLEKFTGTHPQVMQDRIKTMNWQFSFDPTQEIKQPLKYKLANWFEAKTGKRIGEYKNYKII